MDTAVDKLESSEIAMGVAVALSLVRVARNRGVVGAPSFSSVS